MGGQVGMVASTHTDADFMATVEAFAGAVAEVRETLLVPL